MPLLDQIANPQGLRDLDISQLPILADELRQEVISIVSRTGGHLGANLGVIELTIALHYVFNTPHDRLIWDVGHQCYPHKILTGRRRQMHNFRQPGGVSGFTNRTESPYDPFGAFHPANSISAGLGFAIGRDLMGGNNSVVSVIGDGCMGAGLAYEALNHAGDMASKLIVILNDNEMSIGQRVGAMSGYLSRLLVSSSYKLFRQKAKDMVSLLSRSVDKMRRHHDSFHIPRHKMIQNDSFHGGALFEELGFHYVGPIDGHQLDQLVPVLQSLQDRRECGPILLHVVTKKGKGYAPAEAAFDNYHHVKQFDVITGIQKREKTPGLTYTNVFSRTLSTLAEEDTNIVAITAGMTAGVGLSSFSQEFPNRFFDVGIAEQHAISFAAGLACEGFKPFVSIYSSFLQRGYDQVIHDVNYQKLPVRFAIDCAGAPTESTPLQGGYDIAFLSNLSHMVVMAPSDGTELANMIATAADYSEGPIAFRYPKAKTTLLPSHVPTIIPIGKGRILQEGTTIALLNLGDPLKECLLAADQLAIHGLSTTVADARFARPLDLDLLTQLATQHEFLWIIEDGIFGGFSAHVMYILSERGLLDRGAKVRCLDGYTLNGLTADKIVGKVLRVLAETATHAHRSAM